MLYILEYSPPPKSHIPLSLFSPLTKALFIESCLHRPKFDKETLKGSQPFLLQTIIEFHPNSVTTPEIHDNLTFGVFVFES